MVFFRASKDQKIANAVLEQVQPLLNVLERFLDGGIPRGLASDKYVLGFFCANVMVEMRRAGGDSALDTAGRGTVLFLVLQQLFGRGAVNPREIGDLLAAMPTPDNDFKQGMDAAFKIRAVAAGRHKLANDPDYLAARDVVQKAGSSYPGASEGAIEDSKIASEMMRALYYQYVAARYGKQLG